MTEGKNNNLYLGVTGLPCSGKGTFKDFVEKYCIQKGIDFAYIHFTQIIREECLKRGMSNPTRLDYTNIANGLRTERGGGIFALKAVDKIKNDYSHLSNAIFVMEAIRNPFEVEEFRKSLGLNFKLVAVTVNNEQILVERLISRERNDESKNVSKSTLEANILIEQEKGLGNNKQGIKILGCIAMADVKLDNSGSLEEFENNVFKFLSSETCFKENLNNSINKNSTLTQPRIGSAAIVIKDNKILLGIRAKEPNKGKWVLPGGKIKLFESIKEAIFRELLEETGLHCEIGKQIGVYEIIDNPNEHRIIIYNWASPIGGSLKPSSDISELNFFSKSELTELGLTPIVKKVLQDIGWL